MRKGLTLIELVMVLAVLAIIGAILVPSFLTTTEKARLKSDVQSAQIIQNALELYRMEYGKALTGTLPSRITELSAKGYIDANDAVIQTSGAVWDIKDSSGVVVNIFGCTSDTIKSKTLGQLTAAELRFVESASAASSNATKPVGGNEA